LGTTREGVKQQSDTTNLKTDKAYVGKATTEIL